MKTKVTFKGTAYCHYSDKEIESEVIVDRELGDKMRAYCQKNSWNWYSFDKAFPGYLDKLTDLAQLIVAVDYYENVRGYYVDDPEEMGSEKVKSMSLEKRLKYYRSVVKSEASDDEDYESSDEEDDPWYESDCGSSYSSKDRWDEELGDCDAGPCFDIFPPLFENITEEQTEGA